jgi:prepilin-type N-terminal cleavage/methylation domain-containing protein
MSLKLRSRGRAEAGFTLIEMIVVVLLLSIAMLGILAVFDASARINKSEQDVADAQGYVRYGVYRMTRAIRMAGSGGLFVTQAVLNHRDPQLGGIALVNSVDAESFDNVETGTSVTDLSGTAFPVKPGTDMIEIRGVLDSPLVSFDDDAANGCQSVGNTCVGSVNVDAKAVTNMNHVNDDAANRPQFAAIDAYTAGATAQNPMMVLASSNVDIHSGCSGLPPGTANPARFPQSLYNVGVIIGPTTLASSGTFGLVDFGYNAGGFRVTEYDNENPFDSSTALGYNFPNAIKNPLRSAGILDDYLFFIDNTDPSHPGLAEAIRRGGRFDVVRIADDVEDMQIAYGVDLDGDNRVTRFGGGPFPANDPDPNVSALLADDDEWVPNVDGEAPFTADLFQQDATATATTPPFAHGGALPVGHCPRLRGVMVGLVAKGHDPDPTYRADGSLGVRVMNSPVTINPPFPDVAVYPTPPPEPHYRRRVQILKVNLRNYAFEN